MSFLTHLECPECERDFPADVVYIKDKSRNITGSFKARGLAVAVAKAYELGVREIAMPSAGNAGGALAAYAACVGVEGHICWSMNNGVR